jgi:hypothetical protein
LWRLVCTQAAIIDDRIFCMHGGLSPTLSSMDQILNFLRPTDIPDKGVLCDLLWSDPEKGKQRSCQPHRSVRSCVPASAHACACLNALVRAFVRACVCVHVRVCVCVCMCVCAREPTATRVAVLPSTLSTVTEAGRELRCATIGDPYRRVSQATEYPRRPSLHEGCSAPLSRLQDFTGRTGSDRWLD